MKIEFIGVGEAFDLALGNTSLLLHSKLKLLIDCGYAVPQSIKMLGHSNEDIDAIKTRYLVIFMTNVLIIPN